MVKEANIRPGVIFTICSLLLTNCLYQHRVKALRQSLSQNKKIHPDTTLERRVHRLKGDGPPSALVDCLGRPLTLFSAQWAAFFLEDRIHSQGLTLCLP